MEALNIIQLPKGKQLELLYEQLFHAHEALKEDSERQQRELQVHPPLNGTSNISFPSFSPFVQMKITQLEKDVRDGLAREEGLTQDLEAMTEERNRLLGIKALLEVRLIYFALLTAHGTVLRYCGFSFRMKMPN